MRITRRSFWVALGLFLCMLDIHKYSKWVRAGHTYYYRTCDRCSDIQKKGMVRG